MKPTMDTDPAGLVGTVAAAVGAVLALLVAFGIDLTETQIVAILAVVSTVGPIVVAIVIRRRAWAPASHVAAIRRVARREEGDR